MGIDWEYLTGQDEGVEVDWNTYFDDDDDVDNKSHYLSDDDDYNEYHDDYGANDYNPYAYDYKNLSAEELFEEVRNNSEYVCNALLQSVALWDDTYYPLTGGKTVELSYEDDDYYTDLFPIKGFTTMVKACDESDPDALYMYCGLSAGYEDNIYVKPVESGAAYFKSWCGHYFTEEEIEILNAGEELYLPEFLSYEDNYVMGVTIRYNPTHRMITYHYGKPVDKNSKEGKTAELWYKFQEYCQIKGIFFDVTDRNYRIMADFLAFLLTDEGREQLAICQEAGIDWELLKELPDPQAHIKYKRPVDNNPNNSEDDWDDIGM